MAMTEAFFQSESYCSFKLETVPRNTDYDCEQNRNQTRCISPILPDKRTTSAQRKPRHRENAQWFN
jgi:hypothetical protein